MLDAVVAEMDATDAEIGKTDEVDMTSDDASAAVEAIAVAATARRAAAQEKLSELKSVVDAAGEGDLKSQWQAIVEELDLLMQDHVQLADTFLAHARQLTVTGLLETEIPLTVQDLEQGLRVAEASEGVANAADAVRQAANIARDNFVWIGGLALAANDLAPEAGLDALTRFCDEELKVCALMDQVAEAIEQGDDARTQTLLASAYDLHEKSQSMPGPALLEEGYAARFEELHSQEDEHAARLEGLLEALPD